MSANKPQRPDELQDSCNLQVPPTRGACSYIVIGWNWADRCRHPLYERKPVQIAQEPPAECPMRRDH